MKLVILFIATSLFVSCSFLAKVSGDYKEPKKEDLKSISSFSKQIDHHRIFYAKNAVSWKSFFDSINNVITYVYLFNSQGKQIFADSSCPWKSLTEIESIVAKNTSNLNTGKTLENFLQYFDEFEIANNTKFSFFEQKYDYYILYTWAKYVPKLSRQMIDDVNRIAQNSNKKIFVGSLNLDMQKIWK